MVKINRNCFRPAENAQYTDMGRKDYRNYIPLGIQVWSKQMTSSLHIHILNMRTLEQSFSGNISPMTFSKTGIHYCFILNLTEK